MFSKLNTVLSEMQFKDLNENELKTLNFIINNKTPTCCSVIEVICNNCPFYKKHNEMLCLHSLYNTKINRISLYDFSKITKEYLDGGRKYWED